jgi:hypothetical protein
MSDLLQRLIDRTREPLSAVQPILPSIYTPTPMTVNDGGLISQSDLAPEPADRPSTSPTGQADERDTSEGSPPLAEEPIETRTDPAAPAPPRGEADAPSRPPAPKPLSRPLQPPDLKSTLQRKEAGVLPAPTAKNPLTHTEIISPRPTDGKTVPNANEKPEGKASGSIYPSMTRTVVPPGLFSRNPLFANANKPAAMIRKTSPLPAEAALARPAEIKTASSAFESGRSKSTSPLETSAPKAAIPPSQGRPGESREAPAAKDSDSTTASSREKKDADSVTPANRETFASRQVERDSKKSLQNDGRTPPVEVHVSIGHIEVKSAQPNAPAPRRTPPRPRVSLDEFLKHPHYGGPR